MSESRTTQSPAPGVLRVGREALETRAELPGGRELLDLAREQSDLALVGGAVRDLLLGGDPRELDVTVAHGSAELARRLEAAVQTGLAAGAPAPRITLHERFGTASVEWIHGCVDIAELRAESYPQPGALPEVRPAEVVEDLARRDFTVNAIALALGGERRGELAVVDHALEDLGAGRLRVLHERSFIEDPTRMLRLARYAARLGFQIEPRTLSLAQAAITAGALGTVSGARIAAELWLCRQEPRPLEALTALSELGVLGALGLPPRFDSELARAACSLLAPDGDADIAAIAVLFHPAQQDGDEARRAAAQLMESFELPSATRERVLASAFGMSALALELQREQRPSQLRVLFAGRPVEAIAIAGALAARRAPAATTGVRRWLAELRHMRLQIGGEDLLAAGIPAGPQIGRRLDAVLALRLDGELAEGREAELRAAMDAP